MNENDNENKITNPGETVAEEAFSASESHESNSDTENNGVDVQQTPQSYDYYWNNDNEKKKKRRTGKKLAAIMIAATLVMSAVAFWAGAAAAKREDGNESRVEEQSYDASDAISENGNSVSADKPQHIYPSVDTPVYTNDLEELYERCSVSCATIYVKTKSGYSIGSGFVVSEDGCMITNHHVVDGGTEITVIFYNGEKYEAEVVGSDSLSDIAVLRIHAEGLVPIALGDSSNLKIGESVFAIGTPYNLNLAGTMTTGVISGLERKINVTNSYGTVSKTMTLIQTDSSINPGNSGGPLINMAGQVIGINSLKLSNYEGIGFAIPISSALNIANELIEYGEVRDYGEGFVTASPKLNIQVVNVSDARTQYSIPENAPEGCMVMSVDRNSAIYRAGLDLYDIIVEFNGTKIESKEELSEELSKYNAGQKVSVKVYRIFRDGSGQEYTITFNLDAAG